MLRAAITTTRLATTTVIEHQLLSKYKIFSRLSHQFKESNQFATPALRVAPTQSRHRAKRITRDAKYCDTKGKTVVELAGDLFGIFSSLERLC